MADNQHKTVISGEKARQGHKGSRILWLLIISLILVVVVWFAAGTWGTSTAPEPSQQPQSGTTTEAPATNQP